MAEDAPSTPVPAWLTAAEATARLGTKPQTLYANVSRGRIAARPDPEDPRRSLYSAVDVERLRERRPGRPAAGQRAAQSIRWGDPILNSGISTVERGTLLYRGRDAVALSRSATLEDVAALLWQSDDPLLRRMPATARPAAPGLAAALTAIAARVASDLPSLGRGAAALRRDAEDVFATLAAGLIGPRWGPDTSLHEAVAGEWRCPGAADAIRRALVLLADHELNASTFAVRVAVSTGAPLSAGLLSGLAALSGPLHGGAAAAVAALVDTAARIGPVEAVRGELQQGRALAGFGHRLYPRGDVRAAALLDTLDLPPALSSLRHAAADVTGEAPNVDFALVALARVHRLPPAAPLLLFALARSVGWLAHAIEQVREGSLIRPRAHYTGPRDGAV